MDRAQGVPRPVVPQIVVLPRPSPWAGEERTAAGRPVGMGRGNRPSRSQVQARSARQISRPQWGVASSRVGGAPGAVRTGSHRTHRTRPPAPVSWLLQWRRA